MSQRIALRGQIDGGIEQQAAGATVEADVSLGPNFKIGKPLRLQMLFEIVGKLQNHVGLKGHLLFLLVGQIIAGVQYSVISIQ
jgi:hypothetical protein